MTIPLRRSDKCVALSNLASTINGKIYKGHISAPKWNNKFQLPDGSYSISDIQDYFEYFLKKHDVLLLHTTKSLTDNTSIRIYVNKIESSIAFKIKSGYYLALFTMKLLGRTEKKDN